jgi:hypothetical protein
LPLIDPLTDIGVVGPNVFSGQSEDFAMPHAGDDRESNDGSLPYIKN